ncbi:hypothetical protein ACO0LG_06495 [Undibacterium sp. Ji42W]|uniref:hypothetical protein n=1 Tax=Undibacterium sp. Ji42W TaxID=3413039 RepID=UPI003BF448DF
MKHLKIVIAALMVAFAVNFSFAGPVKNGIPKGWTGSGAIASHYESGLDESQGSKEQPAFFIAAKEISTDDDFAAITQVVDASAYRGKIMVLTASAQHTGELGRYELWIRTTDDKGGVRITSSSGAKGDAWETVKVQTPVSANAQKLELGIGIRKQGKLLVKDLSFAEAPANNSISERRPIANDVNIGQASAAIKNLNFSE